MGPSRTGLALAALLLLLGLPTLLFPYGRDQAMFAYVGQVWRDGGLPYRDAWDVKLPAVYAVYALVGGVSWGPRLLDLFAVVVGAAALVCLRRLAWTVGSGQVAVGSGEPVEGRGQEEAGTSGRADLTPPAPLSDAERGEWPEGRDRSESRGRQHSPQSPLGKGGSFLGTEVGGVDGTTSPPGLLFRLGEGEFEPPLPQPPPLKGRGLSVEGQDGGRVGGGRSSSRPRPTGTQDGGGIDGEPVPVQRPLGALPPFEPWGGDSLGLLAVGLLGVFTFGALDYWNLAQTETLIGPLAALAVAAGLGGRPLLAGLLVGAAACFKTTAVLFVLPVGLAVLMTGAGPAKLPARVARLLLGAGVAPLGFVGYFAARGGLPYLMELVRVQAEYAGGDPRTAGLSPIELVRALGLGSYLPLVAVSAVAVGPWLRDRSIDRATRWTVALWWGMALLQIGVQRRFYLYHWSVLTPAAAFLAAYGFWRLWSRGVGGRGPGAGGTAAGTVGREDLTPGPFPEGMGRGRLTGRGEGAGVNPFRLPFGKGESWTAGAYAVYRVVAVGLLVLGGAGPVGRAVGRIPEAVGVGSGKTGVEAYHRGFGGVFDYSVADGMDAGRHVAARSGSEDRLLVLGFEPHVYLYAGRMAPTRHASDAPLFGEKSIREARRQAWLGELLADLERNPPLYYVEWEPPTGIARPEWAEVLNLFRFRYYREEGKYGRFRVYRRRDGVGPRVDTPIPHG